MSLLNWFTRRTPKTTAKSNRTILGVNALEARDVPAVFNLTTVGSSAVVNGALFSQYNDHSAANAANGPVNSFLRIDANGSEEGYNTDGRLQFDEIRRATHSIKVSDLPLVNKGGVDYRELVLDVNEPRRSSQISLDELRVYVSNNPNLRNYNERTNAIGGVAPVFDLDAGRGNNTIRLDGALNNSTGKGDMTLDIPADLLSGGTYLTLYSKFGGRNAAGGGYEQWGPGFVTVTPPTPQTLTVSGFITVSDSNGTHPPTGDVTINIFVTGTNTLAAQFVISPSANGSYSVSFDVADGANYTIEAVDAMDSSLKSNPVDIVTAGTANIDLNLFFQE